MIVALAVEGMNDVLNAQAYTQAAWWYQIPVAAWLLMMTTAFFAMVLVGLRAHSAKSRWHVQVILPVVVTVAFYLIADIDSPRRGLIHVVPQNLVSLAHALHP